MENDTHLIRYLLGELDEDEILELDQQALADDQLAKRLALAEDDLIDAFVRGELEGDRAARLTTRFLASKAGRQRIAFARILARRTDQHGQPSTAAPRDRAAAPERPVLARAGHRRARPYRQRMAWAAVLAIGLGAGWWAVQEARHPARSNPSLLLVQGVRGAETRPRIALPTGARSLSLTLDLEGILLDPSAGTGLLLATIRDARGVERWWGQAPQPARQDGQQAAVLEVPTRALEPGHYTLRLEQVDAKGARRPIGTYSFVVDPSASTE